MLLCDCPQPLYSTSASSWWPAVGITAAIALWACALLVRKCSKRSEWPIPKWCSLSRAVTPEEMKVLALCKKLRFQRYQHFMEVGCLLAVPFIILCGFVLCFQTRSQPSKMEHLYLQTILPEAFFLGLVGLAFVSCQSRFGLGLLDGIFVLVFLSLGMHSAFVATTSDYVSTCRRIEIPQIMIAALVSNRNLFLVPILLNSAWQVAVVLTVPALQTQAQALLFDVFKVTVCIGIITLATHNWTMAEAKAAMELTKATKSQATTYSLLSTICDAVVHLRQDFTLREPCLRLSALLSRSPSLTHVSFQRYLNGNDVERFEQFAARSSESGLGEAKSLHVHLRDSLGSLVPVQLFMTSYEDLDGSTNHLIGVTEEAQEVVQPPQASPADTSASNEPPGSDAFHFTSESDGTGSESMRSRRSDRLPEPQQRVLSHWGSGEPFDEAFMTVRATLQLEVLSESQSCSSLLGLSGEASTLPNLEDFVSGFRESDQVCKWLKKFFLVTVGKGHKGLGNTQSFGNVHIISTTGGSDYEAELVATSTCLMEESEDPLPLSAVFEMYLLPAKQDSQTQARERRQHTHRGAFRQSALMLSRSGADVHDDVIPSER